MSQTTLSDVEVSRVDEFYRWSRQYWLDLSTDPDLGSAGLLNFGCWDEGVGNLYEAQIRLFNLCKEYIAPFQNGSSGLEIGCGIGGNSIRLCQEEPVSLTALDLSPNQLKIAKAGADGSLLRGSIDFVRGNSMQMPLASSAFDFSMCIESSFHYVDLDRFVSEQSRVLKTGAHAVIADITCDTPERVRFRQGNHFYTSAHMCELLHAHGLEVVNVKAIGQYVFLSLYQHAVAFNKGRKDKLAKYWSLVLSNYSKLYADGVMDYVIFHVRKRQVDS
jgi:ubiquinone/menaquinone biosynthesis C-methylase UbiE